MRRYLSLSKPANSARRATPAPASVESEKALLSDQAEESTVVAGPKPPVFAPSLKVKRVDYFYSRWSRKWKYENTGSNVIPELRPLPSDGKDDPWQQYCFVVVREIPREAEQEPHFKVVVKSPYLLKICQDVIGEVPGISWNAIPLELDPQLLLSFLHRFQTYRDELGSKKNPSEEDGYVVSTADTLIDYLRKDYRATVASIENLTSHSEITFDLLFAIFVPHSIMVTKCAITGELQALKLVSATKMKVDTNQFYLLLCENVDVDDTDSPTAGSFCKVQSRIGIPGFKGTVKITSLDAYPIEYYPREAELRTSLIVRGRKWANLSAGPDVHHMQYKGTAAFRTQSKIVKYNVNSRVMIDRASFRRLNPNYSFPVRKPEVVVRETDDARWNESPPHPARRLPAIPPFDPNGVQAQIHHNSTREIPEPTEDELLLASPVLWGFSLSDKVWLEFNVEKVVPVEWDASAFSNLVLPPDRKMLLQSLVEAHNAELGFDDFIKGKGRGLVVNLFGPPGVGKTLSAEATSEHVRRPLYVVGAGDLGMKPSELDLELQRVFELATAWKAIVLIDEADVFLEQRSLHDLKRNAMVAIFLRHLEYYPSILFLTTNRVKTFDEAFLSRIHIALHFHSLAADAREQVWTAFLKKAGVSVGAEGGISLEELKDLRDRDINGRQVKNATKTAQSLAASRGEPLRYQHLSEVLNVMEQFSADFEKMKK